MGLSLLLSFVGLFKHMEKTPVAVSPIVTHLNQQILSSQLQVNKAAFSLMTHSLGNYGITAKMVSKINNTYSCMAFENPINDLVNFGNLYSKAELNSGPSTYDISYTCETSSSITLGPFSPSVLRVLGVVAVILLLGVGCCAYKCGQKKNEQGAYNYQPYGANISLVAGGNPVY